MNQFPLSLSGLGQDHFHPWGWNKEGSNHQHSRPTAFPDDATGVGVWCRVLLGVSVASAHNNHHVSTYVWPTCLQAGSGGSLAAPWVRSALGAAPSVAQRKQVFSQQRQVGAQEACTWLAQPSAVFANIPLAKAGDQTNKDT